MSGEQKSWNKLRSRIIQQFVLGKSSLHGPAHWGRVETIGVKLAEETGADVTVVRLFALFHDSRRESDSDDPGHGSRGAQLAQTLHGTLFDLDDLRMEKLLHACRHHTGGSSSEPTIATCFDADRLDLFRVGVIPDKRHLNTTAAKHPDTVTWAMNLLGRGR